MANPVQLFSWDKPFLPALVDFVDLATEQKPDRAVIVVPHNRPRRYLAELYRERALCRGSAQLLPRVLTVQEFVRLLRGSDPEQAVYSANPLDRVAVLYECVQDVALRDSRLCDRFARMDMPRFLPWGLRLAALFEECFTQHVEATDLSHAEGEVSEVAAVLLNALGRLQKSYVQALAQRRWTTPGLDAFRVAQALTSASGQPDAGTAPGAAPGMLLPALLRPQDSQRVLLLAGFGVLSGTEDAIFRYCWQAGAQVCLHTDTAILSKKGHWACVDHQHWLTRWGAQAQVAHSSAGPQEPPASPQIHFMAAYDVHSQLLALREMLDTSEALEKKDEKPSPSTSIVLADSALLMPTLHALPEKDVNISMGYPLERTPLCRLLENVLHAQTTRPLVPNGADEEQDEQDEQDEGRYHWRSLRHCLRHPYLQLLCARGEDSMGAPESLSLRPVLLRMENLLREGSRFVYAREVAAQALAALGLHVDSPLAQLTHRVLTCVLDNFAQVNSPADMGRAIADLCVLLAEQGEHLWERYPLDAESMYRLLHDIVPTLQSSALADTALPLAALQSLVRQAVQAGRVPFEADPIAGMQVLGMLETRLLHFERVVIVDATDDNVPGSAPQDPLLPDALRLLVGLPDARHRDRTTAYNLFRLMQSAKDVYFYWQEGVQRSALFDGKKSRSRFVDTLIWQEEQRRGALLHAGEAPLLVTPCPVRPMTRSRKALQNTPALKARMAGILAQGLSPTRMDAYMTCPLRFAFEHLCRIKPVQAVNEGDDPAAVGALIHEVLQQVYEPWLHREVRQGDISAADVQQIFAARLDASPLRAQLPPDSYCMLELAGPLRLGRYLEKQPETTYIVALEQKLTASLPVSLPLPVPGAIGDECYTVYGTVDRVDKRHGELVVLDYKTGEVYAPAPTLWADTGFWQSLNCYFAGREATCAHGPEAVPDPMLTLKEQVRSVQLPCYIYLLAHNETLQGHGPVGDAALVRLRDDGEEIRLFGDNADVQAREQAVTEYIPILLSFIVQHMQLAEFFMPIEGKHCQWCEYSGMCLQ